MSSEREKTNDGGASGGDGELEEEVEYENFDYDGMFAGMAEETARKLAARRRKGPSATASSFAGLKQTSLLVDPNEKVKHPDFQCPRLVKSVIYHFFYTTFLTP